MTKQEVLELFAEIGMVEKVASANFSKKFGKKKDIGLQDLYLAYLESKSKYAPEILKYCLDLDNGLPEKVEIILQEQQELKLILSGEKKIDPFLTDGVPQVQALEVYLREHKGYSEAQAASIAKKACNEDGEVKKSSKYYCLFV